MQVVEANGAKIPAIGLGTWQLDGAIGARITEQALRLGYRHLDCALIYGNEREIGEGLRASGVKREQVFITTKVPHTELAPSALERAVKQSLVNLRVSDVNLLLVHWPNPQVPLAETMGAMSKMKKEGYARHIGVSNFTVALIEQAVTLSAEPIVTNQIEWHPYLDESKVKAAWAHRRRRGPQPHRQGARQERRAGVAALARAAGRGRDPAHLEDRAAFGKHGDLRLRAQRGRDGGDRRAREGGRARRQRRLGAALGLGGSMPLRCASARTFHSTPTMISPAPPNTNASICSP